MSRFVPATLIGARRGRRRRARGTAASGPTVAQLQSRLARMRAALQECRLALRARGVDPGPELVEDEEWLDDEGPLQGVPGWMQTAFGGRIAAGPVRSAWGREVRLGPNVAVRARQGVRVVWYQLADGLTLMAEVPDTAISGAVARGVPEIGIVNLLAKGALATVQAVQQGVQAGKQGGNAGSIAKSAGHGFVDSLLPGLLPARRAPDDATSGLIATPRRAAIGCDGCASCRCRAG